MKLLQLVLSLLVCLALSISSYAKECYKLLYIVDGDTIAVFYYGHKEKVRLLGIDTPESKANRRAHYQAKRYHKDLNTIVKLGKAAKTHLRELLSGYTHVCLVYDQNNAYSGHRDRYGRLLAYVYTPDGKFINKLMLEDGYAYLLTQYPLEPRYERILRQAFRYAVENEKGLWSSQESSKKITKTRTFKYRCGEKRYCSQMSSCEEAMFYFNVCGLKRLDRDRDGIPCEKLCR